MTSLTKKNIHKTEALLKVSTASSIKVFGEFPVNYSLLTALVATFASYFIILIQTDQESEMVL